MEFETASPWEARALDQVALDTAADLAIVDLHFRTEQLKERERDFGPIYDAIHAAASVPAKKRKQSLAAVLEVRYGRADAGRILYASSLATLACGVGGHQHSPSTRGLSWPRSMNR